MMDKKNLTVGKSGFIFYQKRHTEKGEKKREYFSLQTKKWKEAVKLRDRYNYEIDTFGEIVSLEPEEHFTIKPLFGAVCEEWYEDKKIDRDVRQSTLDNYKKILNTYILQAPFVDKQIDKIKQYEIYDWWRKELQKTCCSGTINNYLSTLSGIFIYAIGRYIDKNPVDGMKRPKNIPTEIFPFTKLEVNILLDKAGETDDWLRDYLVVKIFTGLRISEINALERNHIDLKKDKIKVRQSIVDGIIDLPKTISSERDVDMCPMVKEAVKRQRKRSMKAGIKFLFFNAWKKPLDGDNFSANHWKPLMDSLDIPYRPFEQTRHTYASLLLAEGGKIGYISKQMGHKNIYITLTRYAKYLPDESDSDILSKVTEFIKSDRDVTEIGDSEKSVNRNNL